jgi:tetratricopeptide (TPR) repeat protein
MAHWPSDEAIMNHSATSADTKFARKEAFRAALASVAAGHHGQAEHEAREILMQQVDDEGALSVLGLALFEQQKFDEALICFKRLTASVPTRPLHWRNLGATLRALERYEDAFLCYAQAAACGAADARFFYEAALLEVDRHQPASAITLLLQARRLAPQSAEISVYLIECCMRAHRHREARQVISKWRSLEGVSDILLARLAALLQTLREPEEANEALKRLTPNAGAEALLTAVHVYERSNRIEDAEKALQRAELTATAALNGELATARARLSARREQHAAACTHWQASSKFMQLRHADLFSYAKCLDANGRYEGAFHVLSCAHQSQLTELNEWLPVSQKISDLSSITEQRCDLADIAEWRDLSIPLDTQSPIFIIGFPRSGTTLLEQALDAHPRLRSMDEQPFLPAVIDSWIRAGIRYPDGLKELSQHQLDDGRELYWKLVRCRVQLRPNDRLIDKNPLNLLRLPAIRRLFPRAKIILAIRHPLDVIWSCYSQPFGSPEFALLCKDLPTLAGNYRAAFDFFYSQLELLRRSIYEPSVYEISYERLVTNFESEMRQLCSTIELEWHASVMDPSRNAKRQHYISTPSYDQVVRPVNARAIGRWQRYRSQLEPVIETVRPYLSRWEYDFPSAEL